MQLASVVAVAEMVALVEQLLLLDLALVVVAVETQTVVVDILG
jgi:hypothetical protein